MVEIHNFTQNEIAAGFFESIARIALKESGVKGEIEISLAIVGDGRMRKLNKMYRGANRVTDVLSFSHRTILPYLAKAFPRIAKDQDFIEAPSDASRLGEIVICWPRAKKQARQAGHPLTKELTILFIHGILHLLGYDHEGDETRVQEMKQMEDRILKLWPRIK